MHLHMIYISVVDTAYKESEECASESASAVSSIFCMNMLFVICFV